MFRNVFRFAPFLVGIIFANSLIATREVDQDIDKKPLFIPLGSWCHAATALKSSGLRKAAYPFDCLPYRPTNI